MEKYPLIPTIEDVNVRVEMGAYLDDLTQGDPFAFMALWVFNTQKLILCYCKSVITEQLTTGDDSDFSLNIKTVCFA